MHKLVTKGHFWRGPPNLKRIKYFNLNFCHNHLLTKPNICAKFEQNRWFELCHLLPGSAWFSHGYTLKKVKRDHRSKFFQFRLNWKEEAWKKSGLQRDSNTPPPRYRCDALPTELWSHTLKATSIFNSWSACAARVIVSCGQMCHSIDGL